MVVDMEDQGQNYLEIDVEVGNSSHGFSSLPRLITGHIPTVGPFVTTSLASQMGGNMLINR